MYKDKLLLKFVDFNDLKLGDTVLLKNRGIFTEYIIIPFIITNINNYKIDMRSSVPITIKSELINIINYLFDEKIFWSKNINDYTITLYNVSYTYITKISKELLDKNI